MGKLNFKSNLVIMVLIILTPLSLFAIDIIAGEEHEFFYTNHADWFAQTVSISYSGQGSQYFSGVGMVMCGGFQMSDYVLISATFSYLCAENTPTGTYSGQFTIVWHNGNQTETITPNVTFNVTGNNADPTIHVIRPLGGFSVWEIGSTHDIVWTDTDIPNTNYVRIQLYDGASNLVSSTLNDHIWSWTISSSLDPGSYRIKISWISDTSVYDFTEYFDLIEPPDPEITAVTQPNNLSEWVLGESYLITWEYQHITGSVMIQLYDGASLEEILTISTSCDGNWIWTLPTNLDPGLNYRIKISWTSNSTIYEYSDYFSIIEPPPVPPADVTATISGDNVLVAWEEPESGDCVIEIAQPNSSSVWDVHTTNEITWTSNNCGYNVKIQLYEGTSLVTMLTASTSNEGSFSWTIPALAGGTDFSIKITCLSDPSCYDYSDYFEIIGNIEEVEYIYDDGVAENATAWNEEGNERAVWFSAQGGPCQVVGGSMHIYDGSWPAGNILTPFTAAVWAYDEATGLPGEMLTFVEVVPTDYFWVSFEFEEPAVVEGTEFFLGYVQGGTYPDCAGISVDETAPVMNRSYKHYLIGGDPWMISSYQDFMLRAILIGPTMREVTLSTKNPVVDFSKLTAYEGTVSKSLPNEPQFSNETVRVQYAPIKEQRQSIAQAGYGRTESEFTGNYNIYRNDSVLDYALASFGNFMTNGRPLDSYSVYRLLEIDENNPDNWDLLSSSEVNLFYIDDEWADLPEGTYKYAVKAIYSNGVSEATFSDTLDRPVFIDDNEIVINHSICISIYPNPFNPETNISFELADDGVVHIEAYNIKGQKVATVLEKQMTAGAHSVVWNAVDQISGIYFLHFEANGESDVKKVILLK